MPNETVVAPLRGDKPSEFRGIFRDDILARELYSEGAGIARCLPAGVAVPADTNDLRELVSWARRAGYSLMPRGSGSGMAAGAIGPGVAVDLSQRKAIGTVDVVKRRICVDAGAVRADVEVAAHAVGLRFPVDPSSSAFCTIGGMTAANAAGARTLRYGSTRAWVTGIECVFDDGSVAWIRRDEPVPMHIPAVARLSQTLELIAKIATPGSFVHAGVRKESSGYAIAQSISANGHLIDLLIGSEGTLAMFTQIELSLTDAVQATATILARFDSLEAATECALRASESGASACELLDRTFLELAASEGASGVPLGSEAVLLAEVEGADSANASNAAINLAGVFRTHGASEVSLALNSHDEHALWELRHAASPIMSRLAPRLRSMQFIEDGCVPPQYLPDYVRGVRAALKKAEFAGVIFGHAGDAHTHVNPLIDTSLAGWQDRVRGTLLDVCELTSRLGGTLAGEHGDGRLRAPLLPHVWSTEARAAFANVKAAGDPAGVFNVGCKVAAPADDLRGELRHDPKATPLSGTARAILDRVERTRSWNAFRLGEIGVDAPTKPKD
ncbi:MAG: FAD-binding oxidoreductase [Gemmatimonadaceae bacterium]